MVGGIVTLWTGEDGNFYVFAAGYEAVRVTCIFRLAVWCPQSVLAGGPVGVSLARPGREAVATVPAAQAMIPAGLCIGPVTRIHFHMYVYMLRPSECAKHRGMIILQD